jgi:hypothetical protein
MKIKQEILDKINNPLVRVRLAVRLGVGEQTLQVRMRKNSSNGRLTKMDALRAISEEVGVDVMEILFDENSIKQRRKHIV